MVYSRSRAKTAKEMHAKRAIMDNKGLLFFSREEGKGNARKEGDNG
jgi:hypothetical protein